MEDTSSPNIAQSSNRLAILGLLFFFVPVGIWGLWISTFSSNPRLTPEEKLNVFLSHFPAFLQSSDSISILVLVSAVASIIFSAVGRGKANDVFKVLTVFVIVVSSLIALLQLFTMM